MADGRGLSAHEIGEGDREGVGDEKQVVEVGGPVAVLPAADALHVAVDEFGELYLGGAGFASGGADVRPDFPSAGEYPGGWWVGVHLSTLE